MTAIRRIVLITIVLLTASILLCACANRLVSAIWPSYGYVLARNHRSVANSRLLASPDDARIVHHEPGELVLGELSPRPGILPTGTLTVTLSLTTTIPADCRWSSTPDTPYIQMPHPFQEGQGQLTHSTPVDGIHDLDDLRYFVRCADTAGLINPDLQEAQTHLRILGPWDGAYPRIANLWPNFESALGLEFYTGYDLIIPYWWPDEAAAVPQLRAANPTAKFLSSQNATYGWPETDELTAEWWISQPGDWGYPCLLRDSSGTILRVEYWGHPMYNLMRPECRTALVRRNLDQFALPPEEAGGDLLYDGIFWDLLKGDISWLGEDIDSDLDGQPDDAGHLDAAYQDAVKDFLSEVRASLPDAILVGNETATAYAPWVNGRMFEWQLWTLLDGPRPLTWDEVFADYDEWSEIGRFPRITFIQGTPSGLVGPDGDRNYDQMPPAMKTEAAADYRRMRFGLATALMSDGLYFFQYETTRGHSWWYDEFGANASQHDPAVPRGYLGHPTGDPALLVDELPTPNQVENGDFANGFEGWGWWVDTGTGAAASLQIDPSGGAEGTPAALVEVHQAAAPWSVLLYQRGLETTANEFYSLSFWARSDFTKTLYAKVAMSGPPGTDYGFSTKAVITPEWQRFVLTDDATVTATDGELDLLVGEGEGRLWLDDIQFQAGSLGVWGRGFDNGLVIINTTLVPQVVPLAGEYCKLNAGQAPLFQTRLDDEEIVVSDGWQSEPADVNQFGRIVYRADGDSQASATYRPDLIYEGEYRVLAWVAPESGLSDSVTVQISHATGQTVVPLDQSTGEPGWRDLGAYLFHLGETGSAVLLATGEGDAVADAFKWEGLARYNDGSKVTQIALQPQDGIILLSDCSDEPQTQAFVPLIEVDSGAP